MKRIGTARRLLLGLTILIVSLLLHALPASAANPTTISFQGKVVNANGTNVTDGTYSFLFKLYTVSSGGAAVWTETQASVTVTSGVFQVNLGSSCSFFVAAACNGSTPIDFNANPALYLGITFNSDPAGEMTPRVQLQSVPYAYNADKVGGLSASQLVQLTPSSQQSGTINVSGNITSAATIQGGIVTATGALQGNTLSVGGGTFAVNATGAITAATGITQGSGSDTFSQNAADIFKIQAAAVPTTDMVNITNVGKAITTDGINAEQIDYYAALAAAVSQASALRLNITNTSAVAGSTTNGLRLTVTTSASAGNTNAISIDSITAGTGTATALNIGSGFTNLIDSPNLTIDSNGNIMDKGLDYFDPSALTAATTTVGSGGVSGGNFGGVASTGAFISNTDMADQEFIASLASATTNNRNVGDNLNWYFNNNAQTQTSSSDISTDGGYFRITNGTTSGRGGLIGEGATPGVLDKPLNAPNLPIVQMKVRPSVVRITDDFVWGMFDTATAPTTNNTLPTNGIFFWTNNSTGATGWQGVIRSGGATIDTVTCPGTIGTNFATGRIVVVNATTVRFFIDTDATNGVTLVDCGTATGALPAADLAMGMYDIHTVTTASTFDMDYARFWQDDSPVASADQPDQTTTEQTLADISTGGDDTTTPLATDPSAVTTSNSDDATPAPDIPAATSTGVSNANQVQLTADGAFQIVDSSGKQLLNVDHVGNLTVNGDITAANATLSGGLSVDGDSVFHGLSTFQKVATFIAKTVFKQDVEIDGHLSVGTDSAGYAKLRKGENSVNVIFKTPYENAPIVSASPADGQFMSSSVSNITTKGFTINLAAPAPADTTLSWTAIGALNPETAINPAPADTTSN